MAKNQMFFNKRLSIILSFAIAIVFWFIITLVENPESDRILNSIDVYLGTNDTVISEQGLSIIGKDGEETKVSVKINGASYVVNSVTAEDILVSPTYENVSAAGEYSVKLTATNNSSKNFNIVSVSPENIDLNFDYIDTVSYDVAIRVKGVSATKGLTLGKERFTNSEKAKLEVSGPRSVISKIKTVRAVANAKDSTALSATKSFEAKIKLYDENDKVISTDGLKLSFESISVSVPVYKSKEVPIKCTYLNKPDKYTPIATVLHADTEITKIKIEGTPDIIDKTEFIELEPIDFNTITPKNNTFDAKFVLPSGVSTVDSFADLKVKVNTSNIISKSFTVTKAVAINNSSKLNVKLAQKLKVTVCGAKNIVSKLTADQLFAEVDLDGKVVGEQTLELKIKSSVSAEIWQVGTYQGKVSIS